MNKSKKHIYNPLNFKFSYKKEKKINYLIDSIELIHWTIYLKIVKVIRMFHKFTTIK